MGCGSYRPAWRKRLTGEERAFGLACAAGLRTAWDVDATAARIAAVADAPAIRRALEKAQRVGRNGPPTVGARAEQALRAALALRQGARS